MPILILFLALPIFAQGSSPKWIEESWRAAHYPSSEWYTGFARDNIKGKPNAGAYEAIERNVQAKLSESIRVQIQNSANLQNTSKSLQAGNKFSEIISTDYQQATKTQSNAVLAKVESYSYFAEESGFIYAFAAVKKTDLANYYESVIKSGLDEAEQNLKSASQLAELGKKRSALEKIAESKSKAEGLAYYKELLIAVDSERGLERSQNSRLSELLKEIISAAAETENTMLIYLNSTEKISGNPTDIMTLGLQSHLTENKCRIADEQKDASYVLNIDAKDCNTKNDGDFYYCYACIKADLTNTKTRKSELKINIDGRNNNNAIKGSEMDAHAACEKAFKLAASKLWNEIGNKIKAEACQ